MHLYFSLKQLLTKHLLESRKRLLRFNTTMNSRKEIKHYIYKNKTPKLESSQVNAAKSFFKTRGYNLKNTYWHSYYTALNGEFHPHYIPNDMFRAVISSQFNEMKQWPALLDKNLSYILFKDFNHPRPVVKNINGFYYINNDVVPEKRAIEVCRAVTSSMIIKPTIESGSGKMVNSFTIKDGLTSYRNLSILELFHLYHKDFIVQEFVEQSTALKSLNPSSLNTIRILSYLKTDGVHILSSVMRIGQPGSDTDNYSGGGIIVGIKDDGRLKSDGFTLDGKILYQTATNIILEDYQIPNYSSLIKMVNAMHLIVPYFKFVSWDIGMDKNDLPVFIEFNTYNQNTDGHQITNGPLFGKFTDEILEIGLKNTL